MCLYFLSVSSLLHLPSYLLACLPAWVSREGRHWYRHVLACIKCAFTFCTRSHSMPSCLCLCILSNSGCPGYCASVLAFCSISFISSACLSCFVRPLQKLFKLPCSPEQTIPSFTFRAIAQGFSADNNLAYEFGFVRESEEDGSPEFEVGGYWYLLRPTFSRQLLLVCLPVYAFWLEVVPQRPLVQ